MLDKDIVRHCAPTLAGLKTGSIFPCSYESRETLLHSIRTLNHRLKSKDLRVMPLRLSGNRALIYVYRPQKLRRDLADSTACNLLAQNGYTPDCCSRCVGRLMQKVRCQEEFPHEIGLFLGYPPEDVQGFIENKACGCKCTGCWKVYGDEEAARKKFAQYKKCTRVYCDQWGKGKDIERLCVAG